MRGGAAGRGGAGAFTRCMADLDLTCGACGGSVTCRPVRCAIEEEGGGGRRGGEGGEKRLRDMHGLILRA